MLSLLLLAGASSALAARACSTANSTTTVAWRQGDVVFDGATTSSRFATIAISLQPEGRGPTYECVAQWPEAWQGWYEGGKDILWSDCIDTGSGPASDDTASFAVDWKTKTFYFSHSYGCSNQEGAKGLATATLNLNVTCGTLDGASRCVSTGPSIGTGRLLFNTTQIPAGPTPPGCRDFADRYQSWEVLDWAREYEAMTPAQIGTGEVPKGDTGPSFSLRNLGAGGSWKCKPQGQKEGVFEGACEGGSMPGAKASFTFDPRLDVLTVKEHMECASTPYDVTGYAYVQADCDRNGNHMTCFNEPMWLGTKVWQADYVTRRVGYGAVTTF